MSWFRHPSLDHADHRPWPLPRHSWAMAQTWSNLLFAHWRVPFEKLRDQIPAGLEIDTFDGDAWIGVVPFELRVRPRFCPVVPKVSAFPELNVRTYVKRDGKPGVWFFSLDATSLIAVRAARWGFNLPYFDARMSCIEENGTFDFQSERSPADVPTIFRGKYRPISEAWKSDVGSLDEWLTERYCLYAANGRGDISRTDVHHEKWPLQTAECEIETNSMTDFIGIELLGEPLLHFVKEIPVVNWLPSRV
ncbi:MAG: YqjF family protein [Planctomycetaceae bacterium]